MRKRFITLAMLTTIVCSGLLSTGCHGHHNKLRQVGVKMLKHRAGLLPHVLRLRHR